MGSDTFFYLKCKNVKTVLFLMHERFFFSFISHENCQVFNYE